MAYKGRVRPTIALTADDIAADAVGSSEIATDAVTANEIAAGAVASSEIATDAVGIAELSATGTADATTVLHGNNTWAAVTSLPTQTSNSGKTLITDGTDASWTPRSGRNLMINGDFKVAQRGASYTSTTPVTNDDDTYTLDRWVLLSDGDDIVDVTQSTSAIDTSGQYCCALSVETANKKFGIFQMAERANCVDFINTGDCTLSFKAKVTGSSLTNVKAAIVGWGSTQDTSVSDIVSAWNVAGTDPTLIANWAYESTPADLNLTGTVQTISITAPVDSTAHVKNIGVFIWSDVTTTTVTDELQIADVQFERGSVATDFEHQKYSQVLLECQRYYFEMDTSLAAYSTNGVVGFRWPQEMRITPNIEWRYPNNTGTANNVYRIDTGGQTVLASGNTQGKNVDGLVYWYNLTGGYANWATTAVMFWMSGEAELD